VNGSQFSNTPEDNFVPDHNREQRAARLSIQVSLSYFKLLEKLLGCRLPQH